MQKNINSKIVAKTLFVDFKKEIESYGYTLLTIEEKYEGAAKKVLCLCPTGEHEISTTIGEIRKSHRESEGNGCRKCCIEKKKIPFSEVLSYLQNIGYKALITEKEYRGVKYPFPGKCARDHDIKIYMGDIYREISCCKICGSIKRQETNIEIRGVPFVAQNEEVKAKMRATNMERRGVPYATQGEDVKAKIIATNMEKRGVPHHGMDEEVKSKTRATNMERRGVPYSSMDEEVKAKMRATNMERRGVPYVGMDEEVKAKMRATNMERIGVPHLFQYEEFKEQARQTNIKNWGVPYPWQNAEFAARQDKNRFARKDYILPSGEIIFYQGYEHFCLDDLLKKEGYTEKQILNAKTDMPKIWYEYDDKSHRYYPDIFIPHEKKLIEVKSQYYFDLEKEVNLLKQKACVDLGYNHEIRIYDKKGKYTIYQEEQQP